MTSTTTNSNTSNSNASGMESNGSEGSNSSTSSSTVDSSVMNRIEEEYIRIADQHGWMKFYQEIREKCEREANEKHYGTSESAKPQNRCFNRYRDVNPYDHSRIIIHRGTVDYINANSVKMERADRKYILTQGPLGDTVGHFWLMVWEQETRAILMLNKLMEKKQIKCHMYWPEKRGPENALKLSEVKLTVEYLRCEEYKNYCRRWFKLTDLETNQSREIIQFHYTTWPDFGIPSSPVAFLQFLKQVRDSGALNTDVGPAVVHCSAGIGRSGTFCLVDCCLVLIDKEGENSVSVQDVLYELRRYRMGLIQTADQLYFSYQAIIEGIKLLKDPSFLNYQETPLRINNDNEQQQQSQKRPEQFFIEETPPPLPPRSHSLFRGEPGNEGNNILDGDDEANVRLHGRQGNRPLPKIPTDGGDDNLANDNMYDEDIRKDAMNNLIKSEFNFDSMPDRPLPPRPPSKGRHQSGQHQPQHHMNAVINHLYDSDSDDNELVDDEDDDDDLRVHIDRDADAVNDNDDEDNDEDDDDSIASISDEKEDDSNKDDDDDRDDHNNGDDKKRNEHAGEECKSKRKISNIESHSNKINEQSTAKATTANSSWSAYNRINEPRVASDKLSQTSRVVNGLENAISSNHTQSSTSPDKELRRRKRTEYQAQLKQKVNDLKRKSHEAEENQKAAKKRRDIKGKNN